MHSREDEYFYVLEGTIIVYCGEEVFTAGPRSFVSLPRGIPHAWDVGGEGVATLLMMTVPAMLEEFLEEFHAASMSFITKVLNPAAKASIGEAKEVAFLAAIGALF